MQSEQINELAKALSIAQGQIQNAKKDMENSFFKSRYADLASVREATRKALADNGLAIVQTGGVADGGTQLVLFTTIVHSSGQWMRGFLPLKPVKDDPQGLVAVITYMRRASLAAITGVATEDDDGNTAAGNAKPETYGAPGNQRSTSPAVNQWHAAALKDIGEAADMKKLEQVYKLAVKHGKASNCTEDQLLMLEQQKDARKAYLQGTFAEQEADQAFERQVGEQG